MGTRITPKVEASGFTFQIVQVGDGPITQVLHPDWLYRDNIGRMSNLILAIDEQLNNTFAESKLILTGGGYIQISERDAGLNVRKNRLSTFSHVYSQAMKIADRIKEYTFGIKRNLVLGMDLIINDFGVGQFGISISNGMVLGVAWKSYPVMDEWKWLAGFGMKEGREVPRYVEFDIGTSMILVCHDVQAFNHRNQALVARASHRTPRMDVIEYMDKEVIDKQPDWAFNLVHYIGKPASTRTFSISYKQLGSDYPKRIRSVGSFGYSKSVKTSLINLASKMQFPSNIVGSLVIVDES